LQDKISWYGSANSNAHITLINLENELTFGLYIGQIKDFCTTINSQKVRFNSFSSFGYSTFFISPDEKSQQYLNNIIIDIHKSIGFDIKNAHAHMTIARGLDAERMKKAQEQFNSTEINFEFICDSIHIRKFNEKTKQYSDIVETIYFNK
jgi:2'-5' RNA ligase